MQETLLYLSEIIKAIKHKGFSFIDILQPCIIFNKQETYEFYRDKIYRLDEIQDYDVSDLNEAINRSLEKENTGRDIL